MSPNQSVSNSNYPASLQVNPSSAGGGGGGDRDHHKAALLSPKPNTAHKAW